jgi:hypothetical protein
MTERETRTTVPSTKMNHKMSKSKYCFYFSDLILCRKNHYKNKTKNQDSLKLHLRVVVQGNVCFDWARALKSENDLFVEYEWSNSSFWPR